MKLKNGTVKSLHIIILIIIAVLFLITGIWKNSSIFSDEDPEYNSNTGRDLTDAAAFWDYYKRASDFLNEALYDSAAVYYENALQYNEDHEGALYYLGNARLFLKDFESAKLKWEKLARINPNSARARLQLGTLYFCMDEGNALYDPAIAEDHFHEASSLNREETGPPLHLSKIAILNSDLNQASNYLDVVLASNFMSYQALFLRGYIEWKTGERSDSFENFTESLQLHKTITEVTMAGEGATSSGFRPMLSEDMFCDFFGNRIEELLTDQSINNHESVYQKFDYNVNEWMYLKGQK